MKITPKQFGYGVLAANCLILGVMLKSCDPYKHEKEMAEKKQYQTEILNKAPEKYEQLIQQEKNDAKILWDKTAQFVDDSIRMDSVAKKAYFEGYQHALDSVNGKQIKGAIKTVSKMAK